MRESRAPRHHAARCVGLALLVTAVLIVPTTEAVAEQRLVDCNSATSGVFTSINDAISSLTGPPPAMGEWDLIFLKSDCTENVKVTGGRRIWIAPEWAPWPGSPTNGRPLPRIVATSAETNALTVQGPQAVTLANLVLTNGRIGLSANGNASVTTYNVVAEHNTFSGINLDTGAALSMYEGGALDNDGYGIRLNVGASATLFGRQSSMRQQPLVIGGNGAGGIRNDRGFVYGLRGVIIENNDGPGLASYAGVSAFGELQVDGVSVFQGNQGGAFVSEGSSITFWANIALRNNGSYGVYVEDGSNASFIAMRNAATGESRAVVVEGHTRVGVQVVAHSQVAFHGRHVIRANGSGQQGTWPAGIWVDGGSHAYLDDGGPRFVDTPPEVVDNAGHGIVVTLNSSIDARAGIVRGNSGVGILIHSRSVGYLGPDRRLLGPTGGVPLLCDSTSLVSSSIVGRSQHCVNVVAAAPRPLRPAMPE